MTNDTKESVENELAEYKKQNANILGPSTKMNKLSEFHKIVVDTETLSTNPADGDIYKHKDAWGDKPAQYIIHAQGLQKLALCAGVFWNPAETRATAMSQKYVAYNAVGCLRKPDGTPECYQAEADIDIDIVEDELRDKFKDKKKEWQKKSWFQNMSTESQNDYIESAIQKELNAQKKHKTKKAATNARSRVIRPLLRTKKTYTLAELAKPFVMLRVILQPDYSDPEVKKMMLTAAIQAQTGVFGPAPSQAPAIDIPNGDYDIRPVPAEENEPEPSPPPATDDKPEKSGLTKEDYDSLPFDEQCLTLEEMATEKGYSVPVPIKEMDDHNRGRLFDHLEALPVPVKSDADDLDIPF